MTGRAKKARNKPSTDRIEKRVVLRAPRSRVWQALSNAKEFGTWFRMNDAGWAGQIKNLAAYVT